MDTRNNSFESFKTQASRRSFRITSACYRVMARHHDHSQSLVTLAQNLRQASTLAKAFCDTIVTNRDGIVSVHVEEWIGTLTEGQWKPLSERNGGFWHRFHNHNHRSRDQRNSSLPKSGDKVECVLLPEKTRKGGWLAKMLRRGLIGPVTNTADVPLSTNPGQVIMLRIGSISYDGKRVQFHWCQGDNPDNR